MEDGGGVGFANTGSGGNGKRRKEIMQW